jgi:hypothetical protein
MILTTSSNQRFAPKPDTQIDVYPQQSAGKVDYLLAQDKKLGAIRQTVEKISRRLSAGPAITWQSPAGQISAQPQLSKCRPAYQCGGF